jgi:hypothetical protein
MQVYKNNNVHIPAFFMSILSTPFSTSRVWLKLSGASLVEFVVVAPTLLMMILGALRIKFRLKLNGVMLGWDIQRKGFRPCTIFEFENAGRDFREPEICNGKVVRKGWYIDKNGQTIETDY